MTRAATLFALLLPLAPHARADATFALCAAKIQKVEVEAHARTEAYVQSPLLLGRWRSNAAAERVAALLQDPALVAPCDGGP